MPGGWGRFPVETIMTTIASVFGYREPQQQGPASPNPRDRCESTVSTSLKR